MRAGRLRHRVALQHPNPDPPAQDAVGGRVESWVTAAGRVPAEVRELRGREFEAVGQALAEVTTRIRIRRHPSLTISPDWRVLHGSTVYQVEHVIDVDGRGRELELMCRALV